MIAIEIKIFIREISGRKIDHYVRYGMNRFGRDKSRPYNTKPANKSSN